MKNESQQATTTTAPDAPANNPMAFIVNGLPGQALVDILLAALDPRAIDNAGWEGLLDAVASREEEIARQEPPSPAVTEEAVRELLGRRVNLIAVALNLPGADGEEAQRRFAQTFGSEKWIAWALDGMKTDREDLSASASLVRFADFASEVLAAPYEKNAPEALKPWARLHIERLFQLHPTRKSLELFRALTNFEEKGRLTGAFTEDLLQRAATEGNLPGEQVAFVEQLLLTRSLEAVKASRPLTGAQEIAPANEKSLRL